MTQTPDTTKTPWKPRLSPGGFDRLAWRRSLRGSGVVGGLTGADWAVLWFAYDHADGLGQVDLPRAYIAERMGLSEASVKRSLRRLTAEHGLLGRVGQPQPGRANRYQLTHPPTPAASATALDEAGSLRITSPDAGQTRGVTHDPPGGSTLHPRGGQPCTPGGVTHDPQSRDKSLRQSSSSRRGRARGDAPPGLFEPPAYDAAAAAVLISSGIASRQTARALVARHGVTREQARNIRANLRAARRAGVAVRNPAGWVRAMVQRGEVMLDPRVMDELDRRRAARKRRADRARQAEQARARAQREARDCARRERATAAYDAMPAADRAALHATLTEGLLANPPATLLRNWAIEELAKQHQQ